MESPFEALHDTVSDRLRRDKYRAAKIRKTRLLIIFALVAASVGTGIGAAIAEVLTFRSTRFAFDRFWGGTFGGITFSAIAVLWKLQKVVRTIVEAELIEGGHFEIDTGKMILTNACAGVLFGGAVGAWLTVEPRAGQCFEIAIGACGGGLFVFAIWFFLWLGFRK